MRERKLRVEEGQKRPQRAGKRENQQGEGGHCGFYQLTRGKLREDNCQI